MGDPLTPHPVWPFIMALGAAVGFGFLAFRSRRNWIAWALGGAAFGLVTATFASGLANAEAVPYTQAVRSSHQFVAAAVTVVIVGLTILVLSRDTP